MLSPQLTIAVVSDGTKYKFNTASQSIDPHLTDIVCAKLDSTFTSLEVILMPFRKNPK